MWITVLSRGSMPVRARSRVLRVRSSGTCVAEPTLSCRIQPYPRVASYAAPVSATYPAGTAEVAGWKLTLATGVGV